MKTPSSELYDLIHSLRQNEKRYFSVFARTLGGGEQDKGYVQLFEKLSRQSAFDEKKARPAGISSARFKRLKHYTYGMVLRSMENFHCEGSSDILLFRYLVQAEILFHKKQFTLLKKCLSRAIALARERDMIQYIVPLVQMQFKSSISLKDTDHSLNTFTAAELRRLSRDSWRWMELRRLDAMFWNLIQTRDSVGSKEKKEFLSIAANALRVYREAPAGYAISREACNVLGLSYRFAGQAEQSYMWRKKLLEVVEKDKKLLPERSAEYIVAIGNLMNQCREMKKNEEVEQLFQKASGYFNSLPARYRQADLDERFCNLKNSYVSFLYMSGNYSEAIHFGELLYDRLRKQPDTFMNSLMPILLRTIVCSGFYLKDRVVCNRYYSLWTRQEEPESDVLGRKLFGLVMYYELGDRDLVHYRGRSFRYAMKRSGHKNLFFLELEKFLSGKALNTKDKKEEQQVFAEFLTRITENSRIMESVKQAGVFNYLGWLKNKAGIR